MVADFTNPVLTVGGKTLMVLQVVGIAISDNATVKVEMSNRVPGSKHQRSTGPQVVESIIPGSSLDDEGGINDHVSLKAFLTR